MPRPQRFTEVEEMLLGQAPTDELLAAAGAKTAEVMIGMVRQARQAAPGLIVAQPNAGQPRVTPSGLVYDARPERFAEELLAMVREGAQLVGGCCGTDPEFIRQTRTAIDAMAGRVTISNMAPNPKSWSQIPANVLILHPNGFRKRNQ